MIVLREQKTKFNNFVETKNIFNYFLYIHMFAMFVVCKMFWHIDIKFMDKN
jgi:hypothetical protein